jgi:hypothetical protein
MISAGIDKLSFVELYPATPMSDCDAVDGSHPTAL